MAEPTQPRRVAVVVVNYGSANLLADNLVRTVADCAPDVVVVVDNPTDAAERTRVRNLAAQHGWLLVEPERNLGFGGGMNLGVAHARRAGAGEFLLLNPDASIAAPALRLLRAALAEDPRAVLAPRILDSSGAVWFDGADLYLDDGRTRGRRHRAAHPGQDRWEWLTGACLLVGSEAWDAAGGFDEEYFLYWEDVDFSRRVVRSGGSLRVVAEAVATHDEGGTHREARTERAKSSTYYYFNIRNRLLFAAVHLGSEGFSRWNGEAWRSAREVLLRGGRRQFLRPWRPVSAAVRGVRDGRRLARQRLAAGTS